MGTLASFDRVRNSSLFSFVVGSFLALEATRLKMTAAEDRIYVESIG